MSDYDRLAIKNTVGKIAQSEVECKITAEDISEVLSVSAHAVRNSCETAENEVKYTGRVIYNLVYIDKNGAYAKTECGVEFSSRAALDSTQNAHVNVKFEVPDTKVKEANGFWSLVSVVEAEITTAIDDAAQYLKAAPEAVTECTEAEYSKSVETTCGKMETEGELELKYAVKDVLAHASSAIVSCAQGGIGCIIVDGIVFVRLTFLQLGENNGIVNEAIQLPFRYELHSERAVPSMSACANAEVIETTVKVSVNEENSTSTASVHTEIEICGELFENVPINYVTDLYSLSREIESERSTISVRKFEKQYVLNKKITAEIALENEELAIDGCIGALPEKLNIDKTKMTAEGAIKFEFAVQGETRLFTALTPFEVDLDSPIGTIVSVNLAIEDFSFRKRRELELEANLVVSVTEYSDAKYNVITAFSEKEAKAVNESALSVYVASENDTLWNVAKTLGVSPETITALNADLQFPLKGDERIVIFRAL